MQRSLIFFISLFLGLTIQAIDSHAQAFFTSKADSLFSEKKYSDAAILYEELLEKHSVNRSNTYLKLAFIEEQKGNFPKAIYFLSQYYELNPNDETFNKISQMAEENSFSGYSRSDLNFILLIYQEYYIWICGALFLMVLYSFYTLLSKKLKGENSALRHKITFIFLLMGVLFLVNVGKYYKHGIVKNQEIFIRSAPSAGAEISSKLEQGNRVNIIGEKDIWLRLWLNGKIQFAKRTDFWIIGED